MNKPINEQGAVKSKGWYWASKQGKKREKARQGIRIVAHAMLNDGLEIPERYKDPKNKVIL